jgi:hypothetical protein
MGLAKLFLMHGMAVSDAIKKRGQLDDYEKAAWKYRKAKKPMSPPGLVYCYWERA